VFCGGGGVLGGSDAFLGGGGNCSAAAQILSAAAEDHVDVDLGDNFVGDVELDEDLGHSLM
jgi:hypothetical protein